MMERLHFISEKVGNALGTGLASICLTIRIFGIVGFVANLPKSSKSFRKEKHNIYLFSFTLLKNIDGRR